MDSQVNLMWATPDPEYQIVRAARVCYQSEDKTDSHWIVTGLDQADDGKIQIKYPVTEVKLGPNDKGLLGKIMTNEHNACLRFASAAFNISGISRVCSHQMVRIAHAGILQKSQRYCNEENTDFAFPDTLSNVWNGAEGPYKDSADFLAKQSLELYTMMVQDGVKEEDARYVLPAAVTTEINMSGNFQMWKHLLKIRLNKKVQPETLDVAGKICTELYKIAPLVFRSDYEKLEDLGI